VGMLSREFLVLVGLAFLAATPVSFFLMKKWLDGFAYRINIYSAWWIFILAGLGAFAITLFTISFQAVKAALANPVNSLRSE
jgi:putative ABC transport system permease protein